MYTSVLLVAMSGLLAPAVLDTPAWQTSYDTARKLGREGHKPLAVFLGTGKAGWNQVSRDGQLGKDTKRLLASEYVCVYVDTTSSAGKALASDFEVTDAPALVLSDRGGSVQAFRHKGELASDDLNRYLQRYSDPERVARRTEGTTVESTSYYAPPAPIQYQYSAPMYFGGSSRGGC